MSRTIEATQAALNATWKMYLYAQHYHWTLVGPSFPYMHRFLGEVYSTIYESIDAFAENIRKIGGMPKLSSVDVPEVNEVEIQLENLLAINKSITELLYTAYDALESGRELGFSNFIQDRIDAHAKLNWMLESTLNRK